MRKTKTAAIALLLAAASVVRADVLENVPDTALVALKVAALSKTSVKVAKLAKDFGIDAYAPALQDPLAAVKNSSGISKGLNDEGDFGIAFFDPKTLGVTSDDAILALIPISDFKTFLTNFGDSRTDGDVTEVALPHDTKPAYVADWNGYAALSPCKALVAKPAGRLKPVGGAAKEAARQDVLLYTNTKVLAPLLQPGMDTGLSDVLGQIDRQANSGFDPKYKPVIKAAVSQIWAMGKTFLTEANSATVGLNISDAGLNYTVMGDFKPDSYLGKFVSSAKGTEQPLTVGLPAMRYLVYGGTKIDAGVFTKLVDDVTQPVVDEFKKINGQEKVSKLVETFRSAMKKSSGGTIAMPVPTNIGQEGVLQQVTIYHGGGPELKASYDAISEFATEAIAGMNPVGNRPKPTVEHKANVKNIGGVSFDTIKFESKPAPGDPMAAQMEQMMNVMYGAEGMTYAYGVSGDDLIISMGANDANLAAIIKSMNAKEEVLSKLDTVKVVAAELPKSRLVEYYVAMDEIVNTGVATAGQFGMPVQLQLPPELPPFGFALATEGTGVRFDAHIPSVTVQSLIAAGMQFYMQMQRGPGGPGGNL